MFFSRKGYWMFFDQILRCRLRVLCVGLICVVVGFGGEVFGAGGRLGGRVLESSLVHEVLIRNGWMSYGDVAKKSHKRLRGVLIAGLVRYSNERLSRVRKIGDDELGWHALNIGFLLEAGGFEGGKLKEMSFDDQRNAMIVNINERTGLGVSDLQLLNNWELVKRGYAYWLPMKLRKVIEKIEDVRGGEIVMYGLRDDVGGKMDALKVLEVEGGKYIGVYHNIGRDGHFHLQLGESADLKVWKRVGDFGANTHQGDLKKMGRGYLLVNEMDVKGKGNHIQVRYYDSLAHLVGNDAGREMHFVRKFSEGAEGTPEIRVIEGDGPDKSRIVIGFHYYRKRVVDRLGMAVLVNFNKLTRWIDDGANRVLEGKGFKGNIGGRYAFEYEGKTYLLQEAQENPGQWDQWRLMIGDGMFYTRLNLKTAGGSGSFANPGITKLRDGRFVVTSFMPTQGNAGGEGGELLYVFGLGE